MLKPLSMEMNSVNFIIRQFFKGACNYELEPKQVQDLTWNMQEEFLNATFYSTLVSKYPVNNNFSRLFLKRLIHYLETSQEVHDDLYALLCMAMKSSVNETFCYRHYLIGNELENIVTIRETNNMVVNGTTGMRTWDAAKILADWALSNIDVFKNKKVLELGSGVGFTGITIAKFCKTQKMLLSDCHEDVIKAIKNNIDINFSSWLNKEATENVFYKNGERYQEIGVIDFDWNKISDLKIEMCPDIVIGADIIYDPTILKPLYDVIKSLFGINKELEIYIAGVIRQEETLRKFLELLDASNLLYLKIEQSEIAYIEWDTKVQRYLLKIYLEK